MFNNKSILAIIPARGGSKGLPRKNVKLLLGKPLIAWTIGQALRSRYLDKVIVSTEDKNIARISLEHGAEVPFIRPRTLATDTAKMIDVILHSLYCLGKKGSVFDLLVLLQPTSPLRTSLDIDTAIELFFLKKAKAIISVCETEHHPFWTNELTRGGCMKNFLKTRIMDKNRQSLPAFYRLNGAIFLAYCDYIKENKNFFGERTYAYVMSRERSVDIDTGFDLKFAEYLLQIKKYSNFKKYV